MRSLQNLMDMRGRVALLTGGAGFIGTAAARALIEMGATVILADLKVAEPEARADALNEDGSKTCFGVICDLESDDKIMALSEFVAEKFGRLDVLVNTAALVGTTPLEGWTVPFADQSIETWRKALEVNLTGPFRVIQILEPMLRSSRHGSVINIGSIYGIVGPDPSLYVGTDMNNPAAYAASKGGLLQLTRWLSVTLAPDIRVNAITPGGIARGQPEVFVENYEKRTPLRRMGTEEDMIGAIAYLSSDLSLYVTGHNLSVDGGWTIM